MSDLLRPPDHRGPLIAAGAVTFSVGVALMLARTEPEAGWILAVTGALAAMWLWLGLQGAEGGPPPAFASVLVVTGLAALGGALVSLADVLGAEDLESGTTTWIALVLAAVAAFASRRRSSAIAALIAALAAGFAVLSAYDWIFEPEGETGMRWLLLALAIAYGLGSLVLRGTSQRHAEQMVNAAGVAILLIPLQSVGDLLFGTLPSLPGFWKLVVLAAGLGLVAYAAADRAPGAAYLGAANLLAFVALAADSDDLLWWPLVLLALGGGVLVVGLRPRRPLPPEPDTSTSPDDLPLTVRVRRD